LLKKILRNVRSIVGSSELTPEAKAELQLDRRGLPEFDAGSEVAIREAVAWLCWAQDETASRDDGVARDYSLLHGWATSYPETTGYIIPTLLARARQQNDDGLRERAKRMLDWFVAIQLDGGGFQGGKIDSTPVVPVTFNTGQILLGLAAGVIEFGDDYRPAMRAAADWLRDSLDADGCWRKHATPFAAPGEKAYETHVSWGLFEAARVDPERGYAEAAMKNLGWALSKQKSNGWFDDCCLTDPQRPLTHTLGYALRGIMEAYRYSQHPELLAAARRTADAIVEVVDADGYLPGRFDANWKPAVSFVCLTGSVQIAHCLFMLYQDTGEANFRDCGFRLTKYVRRTQKTGGPEETRGGIKGAFPVDGGYGAFEYLNWAAKFYIDANMLEAQLRSSNAKPNA